MEAEKKKKKQYSQIRNGYKRVYSGLLCESLGTTDWGN